MFLIRLAYVSYKHERLKHILINRSGKLEPNYVPAQQSEHGSFLNLLCKFELKICTRDLTYFIKFACVSYKHVRYKPILVTDSDQFESDFQRAQQSELNYWLN